MLKLNIAARRRRLQTRGAVTPAVSIGTTAKNACFSYRVFITSCESAVAIKPETHTHAQTVSELKSQRSSTQIQQSVGCTCLLV